MDFSNLKTVENANPTGQNFDIKWKVAKGEFIFSNAQFEKMSLEYNSLREFYGETETDAEGNKRIDEVFIGVCPGNDGVFYKKSQGKGKGKKFKNVQLSNACTEAGLDYKTLSLLYKGNNNGVEMYQIIDETHSITTVEFEEVNSGESKVETIKDEY